MLNRYVLSRLRKIVRDSALVTSVGSEFHVRGAATLKARDGLRSSGDRVCGSVDAFKTAAST